MRIYSVIVVQIQLPSACRITLLHFTGTSIPPSMDLCWIWKRKLFLRHHAGVESCATDPSD